MKRYEFTKGTSRKFWEIGRKGAQVTVRWGRIGATPSEKVHKFGSDQKAKDEHDKLVTEKTKKGYRAASGVAKPAVKARKTSPASKAKAKPKISAKVVPTTTVRGKAGRLFDVTADPVMAVDLAKLTKNLGGLPVGPVMRELVTLCEATLPSSPAEAFSLLGKYGELTFESFVNPHEQIGFRLRSPRHRPFASDHKDVINFLVDAGTSTDDCPIVYDDVVGAEEYSLIAADLATYLSQLAFRSPGSPSEEDMPEFERLVANLKRHSAVSAQRAKSKVPKALKAISLDPKYE